MYYNFVSCTESSVETKQEIETLQETISSLKVQLKAKDENIKGEIIDCLTVLVIIQCFIIVL